MPCFSQVLEPFAELVKVTNDLLRLTDNGLISILLLLDLSTAFDTADHSILLQRLGHVIGIKGAVLGWVISIFIRLLSYTRVSHRGPQGFPL